MHRDHMLGDMGGNNAAAAKDLANIATSASAKPAPTPTSTAKSAAAAGSSAIAQAVTKTLNSGTKSKP